MKKFEKCTNELYGARKAGYIFDPDYSRETDDDFVRKIRSDRGNLFVENKLDELYDFDGDLYKSEDGDYYAVVFVFTDDHYVPLCWQKLIKRNALVSVNNGHSYIDAEETIEYLNDPECPITWDTLVNMMDDDTREQVDKKYACETDLEFLTHYLEIAPFDLIIG